MAESNKTEKATPKKRQDERKKGNAFQSKDVISIVVLIIAFYAINKVGGFIVRQVYFLYLDQLERVASVYQLTPPVLFSIMVGGLKVFFMSALPVMVIISVTVILMTGVQTRFLISGDLIKFKYSRISFIQGTKRLFSLRSAVELVKSIIKISVIIFIIYINFKNLLSITPQLLDVGIPETIVFLKDKILAMVFSICLIFVAVAILDYLYQWYDYESKLKMSKQEVKDEYKQTEGDPFIKGKIKEKQQKMSMNRMIQQVPTADVIIRNPTHFAVALKYNIDKDLAPIVVAKGQDYMAARIIRVAEEHKISIVENRPLARSLYELVDVNDYIPVELYQTVAELMAWIYGERKGKS